MATLVRIALGVVLVTSVVSGILGTAGSRPRYEYEPVISTPAIPHGSTLVIDSQAYHRSQPSVGDIVEFHPSRALAISGKCAQPAKPGSVCDYAATEQAENAEWAHEAKEAEKGLFSQEAEEKQEHQEHLGHAEVSIARIVAGPGDRISIRSSHLIRNGQIEKRSGVSYTCGGATSRYCDLPTIVTIPQGEFFLMSDNRSEIDSRVWGPVRKKLIVGEVVRTVPPGVSPYPPLRGGDIVVAIVGGVLLVLVLTRPDVKWPRVIRDRTGLEGVAEAGLTTFSFIVGGFAYKTLFAVVASSRIDSSAQAALWISAGIILVYALLIHHEPFVTPAGFLWKQYLVCVLASLTLGTVISNSVFGTDSTAGIVVGGILFAALALYAALYAGVTVKTDSEPAGP